jgi:MarR family transcriptional regulator, organic hydroperoxide resistance regulator
MISTSDTSQAMSNDKPLSGYLSWQQILAPNSVGYRIKLLSQLLTRKFAEKLEPFGLTPFHWLVLCCLWQEDGLPTSSIGDKLQQVGGTLTGVIDRMEERNLVRRERDSKDRRIWRIWLTDAGRELEIILLPVATELREEAMGGIPNQEREMFSQILNRVIANLS